MATTKDLIKQALVNIGVTDAGEEPGPEELNDSHDLFKQMVDAWSLERLLVPGVVHESFDVDTVGAANNYTIGTGGDLNTDWPMRIVSCRARDSGGNETVIKITGHKNWGNIDYRNTVEIPSFVYHNSTYPLATLYFDKIWLAGYTIKLISWKEITALPALDSSLAYPPGYELALRSNLQLMLAPAFQRPISKLDKTTAKASKKAIKRLNHKPLTARVDEGLLGRRRGYNIDAGP